MADTYEVPALFGASGSQQPSSTEPELELESVPEAEPRREVGKCPAPPSESASRLAFESAPVPEPSPGMLFLSSLGESDTDGAHVEAALSGFPSFRRVDAEGSLEAVNGVPALLADERRVKRRQVGISLAIIAVLALLALLVDPAGGFFSPSEVLACYDRAFKQLVASIVAPSGLLSEGEILAAHEAYFRVLDAAGVAVATVACGAAVCVGGLLFQASFQRTFAAVPIAGVSAAVLVGQGVALLATGVALGISWVALLVACVVGLAIPFALRFRLNALNLSDEGARQLGVDATSLRRVADGCAIALLVASQVAMGPVFPLALVVPPLARCLFGVEFRHALTGSALLGIIALLIARLIPIPLWISALVISALVIAVRASSRFASLSLA